MYEPMDRYNDGLMNSFKWKIPNDPAVLRHDEVVATLDRAVKKHPRVTFIACHFANCCYDLSILGRMLDAYPNLNADISRQLLPAGELVQIGGTCYAFLLGPQEVRWSRPTATLPSLDPDDGNIVYQEPPQR